MILKPSRISLILMILIISFSQFVLTSCDTAKGRAKKIIALRFECKVILDELYQEYGGSELAQSINDNLRNKSDSGNGTDTQVSEGLANMTQNFDRSVFEEKILKLGRGENILFLSEKSKQFFSRPDVIKRAKKVYEIVLELEMLENIQR